MTDARAKELMRVSLVGMSDRSQQALKVFFEVHCKDICVLADHDRAHVSLIDLDESHGQKHWDAFRKRFPKRPGIVLALAPVEVDGALFVRKPVQPKLLRTSLERIKASILRARKRKTKSAALAASKDRPKPTPHDGHDAVSQQSSRFSARSDKGYQQPGDEPRRTHGAARALTVDTRMQVGTMQDIDPNDEAQAQKVKYQPERFFQATLARALRLAKEQGRFVQITTVSGNVVVFPGGQRVQPKFPSENGCRALCSLPIRPDDIPMSILANDYVTTELNEYPVTSAEALIWQVALFSARGRIPEDTALTNLVYMKSWPNMTRLSLFPHAMRIAALWANLPYSLIDTAKVLRIQQRYVFAFYSAAHALGIVGTTSGKRSESDRAALLGKSTEAGLFQRILAKLHQSSPLY